MPRTDGFPVVRVAGSPEERGRAYGSAARRQIHGSIALYADVFCHYTGWDWPSVRARAARYTRAVAEFAPQTALELAAIAGGAGVDVDDIMALNARSEIMFSASSASRSRLAVECTAFAVTAGRTSESRLLAGQNWDWIEGCAANVIVLEARRDDLPDFVTVVEAGMVAKVGLNAAGVGLCTNTLVGDGDEGRDGVPYHVLLRAVLDSTGGKEAAATVRNAPRANSANYLIVDDSGYIVDLETAPTAGGTRTLRPRGGVLAHANHFLSSGLTGLDRYLERKPHSLDRLASMNDALAGPGPLTLEALQGALADHRNAPLSICQHPNPDVPAAERTCTLAGVTLDVTNRRMMVAAGPPCTAPWADIVLGRHG